MLEQESTTHLIRQTSLPTKVEACGKVILVGEHAVVYGARAVAMPLKELTLQLDVRLKGQKIDMMLGGRRVSKQVEAVVQDAFHVLEEDVQGCLIRGSSSLPTGAGLGSSASLCVALLKGVAAALGKTLAPADVASLANRMETRFHGNPSGLDAATVAYESALCFRKNGMAIPTQWRGQEPLRFVLIDSQVRASTLAMVRIAAPYFKDAQYGEQRVAAFDKCSEQVIAGLTDGCRQDIVSAMQEVAQLLNDSGVVTALLMDMMKRAQTCGVEAIKPTGAAGGGYLLALLPEKGWQDVQEKLEDCFGVSCVLQAWLSPH